MLACAPEFPTPMTYSPPYIYLAGATGEGRWWPAAQVGRRTMLDRPR